MSDQEGDLTPCQGIFMLTNQPMGDEHPLDTLLLPGPMGALVQQRPMEAQLAHG